MWDVSIHAGGNEALTPRPLTKTKPFRKDPEKRREEKENEKLFAVAMTLALMLTAAAAFAGEAASTPINWSDFEAEAAKVEGQFTTLGNIGLKIFVPAEFKDMEISQELQEGGTLVVLHSDREEKAVVNVQFAQGSAADFRASMESKGVTVREYTVNSIPCLGFATETEGVVTSSFVFGAGSQGILVFSFTLANQEPYTGLYRMMTASIQLAE